MKFSYSNIDLMSPTEFEEFVMDCFERAGWKNLHRTQVGIDARYGDGGYDIEGWREDRKWLIEVKQRSNSNVGIECLRQIESAGRKHNSKNLVLVTNQDFSSVVHDEAAKLGVELFNRNKLHTLFLQGKTDIGKRIKLRSYQQGIIDKFEEKFQRNNQTKFLIEMATGLGKTVTSAALVERMIELSNVENPKVLFVVHQKEIVKQSRESYKSYFGFTKYQYSVLYDGEQIQDHNFVFATFQTMLMQKNSLPRNYFDIIVVDEAHHFAATSFSRLNELFDPKFILGLTATPERSDKKDIYSFFGGVDSALGKLDLAWALRNNHLAKPKYHILSDDIDVEKLSSIKNGLSKSELDKTLFLHKRDDEIISIIQNQLKLAGVLVPKCIVFCKNIRHINNFINYLPPGTATIIHSKMDRESQRRAISEFREGSYQYILTVDIFNEGVDIPEVNSLVFLRSTASKTIWLQQLGRGLRKTPEKNFVEVFDFVGSVGRILEVNELKNNIKKATVDKSSDLSNEDKNTHEEDKEIIHDSELDVAYSKYAAEVQKLLEQYQFKMSSKQDCIDELIRIEKKLGRTPSINEFCEEIESISADQVVTIFGDYLNMLSCVYGDVHILGYKSFIETKIRNHAIEHFKLNTVIPSAEMVQISSMETEIPLANTAYIKNIIKTITFKSELSPSNTSSNEDVGTITSVELSQRELLDLFKDIIFSLEDLKKISLEDKRAIRSKFLLDVDFIKELQLYRNSTKAS